MAHRLTLVALAAIAALAIAQPPNTTPVTIKAPVGPVIGYINHNARVFRGVPFAEPPVGSLRWAAPQAIKGWSTPFQAFQDAPGCPQDCELPPHTCPPVMSEDCLYMNIFTPKQATPSSNLPVMMFVHGGNFKQGYAGGLLYDSSNFANYTDTIIVVIQYRLGALGFLYTGNDNITGNFGLQDQRMALRWLQQNIAAFGGNPNLITIFGQSAGAMSIASHLVSPNSEGLFQRAILESEPFGLPFRTPSSWPATAGALAQYTGCAVTDTACLRAVNVTALIAAQVKVETDFLANLQQLLQIFLPWTPTAGVDELPMQPYDAWRAGMTHDVPIMIGTVRDEGLVFVWEAFTKPVPALEYSVLLGLIFGLDDGARILLQFPLPSNQDTDARNFTGMIATDSLFVCPTRNATLHASRTSPTYVYHFTHVMSFGPEAWGPMFPECWDKVCHAGELPFLFMPNGTAAGITFTPAEQQMGHSIQSYWSTFARTGAPGSGSASNPVAWPVFDASMNVLLIQTPNNVVLNSPGNSTCTFWDSIGYHWY